MGTPKQSSAFRRKALVVDRKYIVILLALLSPLNVALANTTCDEDFGLLTKTNRAKLITSPQGRTLSFTYEFKGKNKKINAKIQPEWEMKIMVPDALAGAGGQRALVTAILDHSLAQQKLGKKRRHWGFSPNKYDHESNLDGAPNIYPSALSSKEDFWHDNHLVKPDSGYKIRSTNTTQEINKNDVWVHPIKGKTIYTHAINGTREKLKASYFVGYQFEQGKYFDTPDGALKQQGVALRTKEWSPISKTGAVGEPEAKMLFIKIDRQDELTVDGQTIKQPLRLRDEYQVPIPLKMSDEEILTLATSLLKEAHIPVDTSLLAEAVNVSNYRYGIDLLQNSYKNDEEVTKKIGFITVDRFQLSMAPGKEVQQIEIEIFPKHLSDYAAHANELSDVIDVIRKAAPNNRIELSKTPKYLQID